METPDITPVQIRAVVLWVVSFLSLFGVGVSSEVSEQIIALCVGFATALPTILVLADAIIRRARANNIDAILRNRPPADAVVYDGD